MRCREDRTSFSEGADWPQDPGVDGPNTLCNAGLRPSPTTELLLLCASAWQWSTPSSLQQPHRPTRAARAQPGPAALASVGAPALWLVRERNSAAPRSGRPSAPALQTRARFRHPLSPKSKTLLEYLPLVCVPSRPGVAWFSLYIGITRVDRDSFARRGATLRFFDAFQKITSTSTITSRETILDFDFSSKKILPHRPTPEDDCE